VNNNAMLVLGVVVVGGGVFWWMRRSRGPVAGSSGRPTLADYQKYSMEDIAAWAKREQGTKISG